MKTISGSKAAIAGATLVFAFLAAVTLTLAPGAAHAQSLQLQQPSTIAIDSIAPLADITVSYAGAGCAVPASGAFNCTPWNILGGAIPNGSVLGTIALFTLAGHLSINLMFGFPSGCQVNLGLRLLNYNAGTTLYALLTTVGAWSTSGCTQAEIDLITHSIGASPSAAHVSALFSINHV